jgi:hypothetical protein
MLIKESTLRQIIREELKRPLRETVVLLMFEQLLEDLNSTRSAAATGYGQHSVQGSEMAKSSSSESLKTLKSLIMSAMQDKSVLPHVSELGKQWSSFSKQDKRATKISSEHIKKLPEIQKINRALFDKAMTFMVKLVSDAIKANQ